MTKNVSRKTQDRNGKEKMILKVKLYFHLRGNNEFVFNQENVHHHIVRDFPSLCLSIPLGQTHTEGLVCFCRARNPITFETTSVAANDSPAGCLIALTAAARHSTACVVETFPVGLETVFLH